MNLDLAQPVQLRRLHALIVAVATALGACEADTIGSADGGSEPAVDTSVTPALPRAQDDAGPSQTAPNAGGSPAAKDAGTAAPSVPAVTPPVPAVTPPVLPPITPTPGVLIDAGTAIDSGISAECDAQVAKCQAVGPDLIRDCVAVARHCVPVNASPACRAQADKCEQGSAPLLDCPAVALVCP